MPVQISGDLQAPALAGVLPLYFSNALAQVTEASRLIDHAFDVMPVKPVGGTDTFTYAVETAGQGFYDTAYDPLGWTAIAPEAEIQTPLPYSTSTRTGTFQRIEIGTIFCSDIQSQYNASMGINSDEWAMDRIAVAAAGKLGLRAATMLTNTANFGGNSDMGNITSASFGLNTAIELVQNYFIQTGYWSRNTDNRLHAIVAGNYQQYFRLMNEVANSPWGINVAKTSGVIPESALVNYFSETFRLNLLPTDFWYKAAGTLTSPFKASNGYMPFFLKQSGTLPSWGKIFVPTGFDLDTELSSEDIKKLAPYSGMISVVAEREKGARKGTAYYAELRVAMEVQCPEAGYLYTGIAA